MSNNENFGFGKLVPGFDFLQNIAKGASQMPNLSNWIAPTLNPEELEKRIGELKAVHFWLDQNSKALGATIQALEVQKMTLATLKGMNFNMGEVANAFKLKTDGVATVRKRPARKPPPRPTRIRMPQTRPRPPPITVRSQVDSPRLALSIRCSGGARSPSNSSRSQLAP
jgi:hypothetical protein